MKMLYLASFVLLTQASSLSAQAGFDCTKAQSDIEQMICSDPVAAQSDLAMSEAFAALMKTAPEAMRAALRKDQRDFLTLREDAFLTTRGPDSPLARLQEDTAQRAAFLQRLSLAPSDSFLGEWRNAYGSITVVPSREEGRFTVDAVAADQANGSWLCAFEGMMLLNQAGELEGETLGGELILAREGAMLSIETPYCSEAGPTPDGSFIGHYFRMGEAG